MMPDIDPFDDVDLALLAATEPPGKPLVCPFRVAVDVNEGIPYRFTNITSDASTGSRTVIVETVTKPLYSMGRLSIEVKGKHFTKGLADYSIDGMEQEIQIERKSLEDLYGTLGGRRDDFEAEISRLNLCRFAAVVIEAGWWKILFEPPAHSQLNPKTVGRTILSWSIRYQNVHWFTCEGRSHGEQVAYRLLEMFWRQRQHDAK